MYLKDTNANVMHIGPETPMGEVLRRFWLPAVLEQELPAYDEAPLTLRLLGEDLLLTRGARGEIDVSSADLHEHAVGYMAIVRGGVTWLYMGPHDFMPQPPDFEWSIFLPARRYATRIVESRNWAEALEGALTRGSQFLVPFYTILPADEIKNMPYHGHAWVPIDDTQMVLWSFGANPKTDWTSDERAAFCAAPVPRGPVDETDKRVSAFRHSMIVHARENARGHAPDAAQHGDWYALISADRSLIPT